MFILCLLCILLCEFVISDHGHEFKRHGHGGPNKSQEEQHPAHPHGQCHRMLHRLCGQVRGTDRQLCIYNHLNSLPGRCAAKILHRFPLLTCAPETVQLCPNIIGLSRPEQVQTAICLLNQFDQLTLPCQTAVESTPVRICKYEARRLCPSLEGPSLVECMTTAYFESELEGDCQRVMSLVLGPPSPPPGPPLVRPPRGPPVDQTAVYYGIDQEPVRGLPWIVIIAGLAIFTFFVGSLVFVVRTVCLTRSKSEGIVQEYVPPTLDVEDPFFQAQTQDDSSAAPEFIIRQGIRYEKV